MWIPLAIAIATVGAVWPGLRRLVGAPIYGACVVVTLITLYGMTLP